MRRVRLRFAGREVEFVDRERALRQVSEWAERGAWLVRVVYGPEGCGKTSLLKQVRALLEEEFEYSIIYVNPLARDEKEILSYTPSLREIVEEVLKSISEPYSRIVDVAITVVVRALKKLRKPRIAILMDDLFQAVGLDKAETYTKILLNLIEYPSGEYEKIVVLVSSSEGVTRERIGRHRWAELFILWNMGKEGFRQLYEVLPEPKPPFEEVWRITGGNPEMLERLYEYGWSVEDVVDWLVGSKDLERFALSLSRGEAEMLMQAVEDPDIIFERLREPEAQQLERKLVELNLIVGLWSRSSRFWIDVPPPEKDLELGIGRFYAWQTPLHREAVRRCISRLTGAHQ